MKGIICAWVFVSLSLLIGCSNKADVNPNPKPTDTTKIFKGADVSWLTQMELQGIKFYTPSGDAEDCIQILKDLGINCIRLRAWVNPANEWNSTADVVAKAKRAKALGMKLMIDLHYSDTWADPGHQSKPAEWSSLPFDSLVIALSEYTKTTMDTLVAAGVTPDWVQVGNEVDDGMLWPDGKASLHMSNFAKLVKAGYDAVKSVNSSTQVIVHVSNGYDQDHFKWIFDGLKNNGAEWDIIGMSLYPSYSQSAVSFVTQQCRDNMNAMVDRYGTPVMVVEVGMPATPASEAKDFLTDLISKTKSVNEKKGLGVFYWEPECYNNWSGYGLGAFDNNGRPSVALDAFKD